MPSIDLPPGWRSPEQLQWMSTTLRPHGIRPSCYHAALEVGTYCGRTTRTLLESVDGAVFGVEPLGLPAINQEMHEATADREHYLDLLAAEFPTRFVLFPCYSHQLLWHRPIDVLLLDGDHSFEGVYGDLDRLAKYVNPGGLLFIDAWDHPNKPEVKPAWDEYLDDLRQPGLWLHIGFSKHLHVWKKADLAG